jgi:hypothetical protein
MADGRVNRASLAAHRSAGLRPEEAIEQLLRGRAAGNQPLATGRLSCHTLPQRRPTGAEQQSAAESCRDHAISRTTPLDERVSSSGAPDSPGGPALARRAQKEIRPRFGFQPSDAHPAPAHPFTLSPSLPDALPIMDNLPEDLSQSLSAQKSRSGRAATETNASLRRTSLLVTLTGPILGA